MCDRFIVRTTYYVYPHAQGPPVCRAGMVHARKVGFSVSQLEPFKVAFSPSPSGRVWRGSIGEISAASAVRWRRPMAWVMIPASLPFVILFRRTAALHPHALPLRLPFFPSTLNINALIPPPHTAPSRTCGPCSSCQRCPAETHYSSRGPQAWAGSREAGRLSRGFYPIWVRMIGKCSPGLSRPLRHYRVIMFTSWLGNDMTNLIYHKPPHVFVASPMETMRRY